MVSAKNVSSQVWPQTIVNIVFEAHLAGWSSQEINKLWEVHGIMARIFSGRYRGSGRPFMNHLAGTAGLALRYSGEITEVLAAYAHAAYAQGEFGRVRRGASRANRKELQTAIGDKAEALVADYTGFNWTGLVERKNIDEVLSLSAKARRIVFLYIVNEFDDSADYCVYNASCCEGCLKRLLAGAEFAKALGHLSLANELKTRAHYLEDIEPTRTKYSRAKISETILNPSTKTRSLLRLMRRIIRT